MKLKELINSGDYHELGYEVNGLTQPFLTAHEGGAHVVFTDDMHFHMEHYADALEELGILSDSEWLNLPYVSGWIMVRIVESEAGLSEGAVSVDLNDGGEYTTLEYAYELPPEALEMDVDSEELFELCWDFLATCVNVTDPGTFGSPYIITKAARILEEYKQEDQVFTIEELVSH